MHGCVLVCLLSKVSVHHYAIPAYIYLHMLEPLLRYSFSCIYSRKNALLASLFASCPCAMNEVARFRVFHSHGKTITHTHM